MQAVEHEMQLGHCFSHNMHSHSQIRSATLIGIAHYHEDDIQSWQKCPDPMRDTLSKVCICNQSQRWKCTEDQTYHELEVSHCLQPMLSERCRLM